jgi:hypothetical protein
VSNGIEITGEVAMPNGFSAQGTWKDVQLLNANITGTVDAELYAGSLTSPIHASINGVGTVLDGGDPYPFSSAQSSFAQTTFTTGTGANTMVDAPRAYLDDLWLNFPNIGYNPAHTTQMQIAETFQTYLMFKPPGSNVRWVPLSYIMWGWNANVGYAGHIYFLNSSGGPSPSDYVSGLDEPVWTANGDAFRGAVLG